MSFARKSEPTFQYFLWTFSGAPLVSFLSTRTNSGLLRLGLARQACGKLNAAFTIVITRQHIYRSGPPKPLPKVSYYGHGMLGTPKSSD